MKEPATTLGIATLLMACCPWPATAATDRQKEAAIQKGLAYLYTSQQTGGWWAYSGRERTATGAASYAFLAQQDKWANEAVRYQLAVDKAIRYLLREARVANVSLRDDGANVCPGQAASCRAIAWFDDADAIYTTAAIAPAIALYGLKAGANAVATSTGELAGMTWADIAQAITNFYSARQVTSSKGNVSGAWLYRGPAGKDPDRWTTQPAAISFVYDQLLGAETPQAVKQQLRTWLTGVQRASGAICYAESGVERCGVINIGEWLLATAVAAYDIPGQQRDAILANLNAAWASNASDSWQGNFGHPYAMWTVYAGLNTVLGFKDTRYISKFSTDCGAAAGKRPTSLPLNAACTWAEDYNEWLVESQKPDGSWGGYSYWTGALAAAFYINILGAVDIPGGAYKCPVPQAFWQDSRVKWPVASLTLGGQTYGQSELLTFLSAPVGSGNAAFIFVDELITAKLNLAQGSESRSIADAIAYADTLLSELKSRLPYQVDPSSQIGQQMMAHADLLDRYNSGAMTPACTGGRGGAGSSQDQEQLGRQLGQPTLMTESLAGSAAASVGTAQAAAKSKKLRPYTRKGVTSIALNADGTALATASTENRIRIWAPTTGQQILLLPATLNTPTDLTFSPNGATLQGVARDSVVHVWDAVSGNELAALAGHEAAIRAVAASPAGMLLASAGEDTRLMLWDTGSLKLSNVLFGATNFLNALAFSPDGKLVAAAGEDARVLLFDITAGGVRYTLRGHSGPVDAVSFSPDGTILASAGQDTVIHVWDAVNGIQRQALSGHQAPVRAVTFSPYGQTIASAGEDTRIILWDAATGAIAKILEGSTGAVNALCFAPHGDFLVSATETGEISLWNTTTGKKMFTFAIPI